MGLLHSNPVLNAESLIDTLLDDLEQCPTSEIDAPVSRLCSTLADSWLTLSAEEKNNLRGQAIRLATQFVDESHEVDSVAALLADLFLHRMRIAESEYSDERRAFKIRWAALMAAWEKNRRSPSTPRLPR
jgi:hypothetical protein